MEIAAHGVYSLLASPKVFGVLIIWPVQIVNVKGRSGCLLANLTTVVSSIAGMSSLVMTEFDLVRFPFWAKVMAYLIFCSTDLGALLRGRISRRSFLIAALDRARSHNFSHFPARNAFFALSMLLLRLR